MGLFRTSRKQTQEECYHPAASRVFPKKKAYEETTHYFDNQPTTKAILICLPYRDWIDLSNHSFYRELIAFLENRGIKEPSSHQEGIKKGKIIEAIRKGDRKMKRKRKAEIICRRLAANGVFKKSCENEGLTLIIEEALKEIKTKREENQ